jgi:hypothetical protein
MTQVLLWILCWMILLPILIMLTNCGEAPVTALRHGEEIIRPQEIFGEWDSRNG